VATAKRFAFVLSTSGSVMSRVLTSEFLRSRTALVVAEAGCSGLDRARAFGIASRAIDHPEPEPFCRELAEALEACRIDYVMSFYTRFYSDEFRALYRDRIINFHPSLLPAFKGMDGFGDGIAYHTRIIGTTVELIKDVMDEGKIVMQTACAVDPALSRADLRHRIFEQQCRSLLQVAKWLDEDRIEVHGNRVAVRGARYAGPEFAPALDFADAVTLDVPPPPSVTSTGAAGTGRSATG